MVRLNTRACDDGAQSSAVSHHLPAARPPLAHRSPGQPPHMMKTRAPYFACAAALSALIALAHAQDSCDSAQIGNETQFAYSLAERRVEPNMFTLEISEPDVCSDSKAVGLKVMACDREQAPRVYLLDTARGLVVREGNVATAANVYITAYCASEPDEGSDESVESPMVSSRFLEEALPQSSSIPPPPLPAVPPFESIFTETTLPMQPRAIFTSDSLPISEVKPPPILASSKVEYLPPMQLESRFSSLDQSKGHSIPTSVSSRLKGMWKEGAVSSLGQLKSQSFLKGISSRLQETEQSLLDKTKHKPSMIDSYSTFLNGLPKLSDTSSLTLAKRLKALRPKQPSQWLAERSPAWLKRPTRRPSYYVRRSLTDGETRKSMSRSSNRPASRFSDYGDPWSPYEDDPLYLHWLEEPTNPYTRYGEGEPQAYYVSGPAWRSQHPPTFPHEYRSPLSIKHISKKRTRYVPPIHEEDPALLESWVKELHRPSRPLLPKLLLLLQDQEHPLHQRQYMSSHSVEDAEPWWSKQPFTDNADEGLPWQPDYPTDYSADDGDSRSYLPGRYDDGELASQHAPAYHEEPEHLPWCSQCAEHYAPDPPPPPPHAYHNARHKDAGPAPLVPHPPPESFLYYSPSSQTERPLLTSTVRHSLSWVKNTNPAPHINLKQQTSMSGEHHRSAAPWSFLSQLLLSHPTFRDSTHVIRIR